MSHTILKERCKNVIKYNKLVRDKIPDIIRNDGRTASHYTLSEEEYIMELDKKLNEEVNEYQIDKNLEEMADILEVLYGICKARGFSIDELEAKRKEKALLRGNFDNRVFLEFVEDEHKTNDETGSSLFEMG
jgi:predicted house-cleaning noncanonical NTP pyrophosphatase (MazG superfamily)